MSVIVEVGDEVALVFANIEFEVLLWIIAFTPTSSGVLPELQRFNVELHP